MKGLYYTSMYAYIPSINAITNIHSIDFDLQYCIIVALNTIRPNFEEVSWEQEALDICEILTEDSISSGMNVQYIPLALDEIELLDASSSYAKLFEVLVDVDKIEYQFITDKVIQKDTNTTIGCTEYYDVKQLGKKVKRYLMPIEHFDNVKFQEINFEECEILGDNI